MKRQRGRNRRSGGGNQNPNRHYESNGPDVKIRGSAQQILDKYLQYARDAQTSGDRVMSEAYFQHAEHYQRLISAMQPKDRPKRERNEDEDDNREDDARSDADDADETDASSESQDDDQQDEKDERTAARRGKRRQRSDDDGDGDEKSEKDNPLKVVDQDESEAPRSRRRKYKKREDSESGDDGSSDEDDTANDGVMKTLSRGRRKVAEDTVEPVESGD